MTPKELRLKSNVELKKLRTDLTQEYFLLKMKQASGQLEKSHKLGELKREIARILTIQKEGVRA